MIFAKPWADALIVLIVVLLFFGPKRLPLLGRSLGEGMREFKDSITGKSGSDDEEEQGEIDQAASAQPVSTSPPPATPQPVASPAEPEPAGSRAEPEAAGSRAEPEAAAATAEPESAQVASSEPRS